MTNAKAEFVSAMMRATLDTSDLHVVAERMVAEGWRPPLPEGGEEIGDDVIVHFEGRPVVGRPLSVKVGWEGDQFVELPRGFAVPASSPLPDSETESKWRTAYEQKLGDFARETLRTSELTRERDELRRLLAERETPVEDRYVEGDQVEIYTVGRWEPADICRDYGGDRIEARDWGQTVHTCRREDVRRREVTS